MCVLGKVIKVINLTEDKALVSHRSWRFHLTPLARTNTRTKWQLGNVVKSHAKPTIKNNAGLYGYKSPRYRPKVRNDFICGSIKIWGDIVVHQYGYRASHAKIFKITKGWHNLPSSEPPKRIFSPLLEAYKIK